MSVSSSASGGTPPGLMRGVTAALNLGLERRIKSAKPMVQNKPNAAALRIMEHSRRRMFSAGGRNTATAGPGWNDAPPTPKLRNVRPQAAVRRVRDRQASTKRVQHITSKRWEAAYANGNGKGKKTQGAPGSRSSNRPQQARGQRGSRPPPHTDAYAAQQEGRDRMVYPNYRSAAEERAAGEQGRGTPRPSTAHQGGDGWVGWGGVGCGVACVRRSGCGVAETECGNN